MIAVQSDEIEWLRDAIEDTTNDYDILRDLLYRIRHRLNDHPHSTDTTLGHVHTMIDHIVRITDVTNKEHERLKKEIDERLEKLKGAHVNYENGSK